MKKKEIELAAKVADWFARAEAEDEAEDREHGVDSRGDEMPDWVRDKQKRLEQIRAAKGDGVSRLVQALTHLALTRETIVLVDHAGTAYSSHRDHRDQGIVIAPSRAS